MSVIVEIFAASVPHFRQPALASSSCPIIRFMRGADRVAHVLPRTAETCSARAAAVGAGP